MHCCKLSLYTISRKANEQNLRIWQKNLILGLILARLAQILAPKYFLWVLPPLDIRNCCKLSLHGITSKSNEPKLEKMTKNLVLGPIMAPLPKIRVTKFFFQKSGFVCH